MFANLLIRTQTPPEHPKNYSVLIIFFLFHTMSNILVKKTVAKVTYKRSETRIQFSKSFSKIKTLL